MRKLTPRRGVIAGGLSVAASLALPRAALAGAAPDAALTAAIAGPVRSASNAARDRYRHPARTLEFFGLRDDLSVLEIEPGAGYWTEILAPYLRAQGEYRVALPVPRNAHQAQAWRRFDAKLLSDPAVYQNVIVGGMSDAAPLAPAGLVDLVLSFRNLHDWMADGTAAAKFAAIYAVLKPGGVLGIEDHRGLASVPQDLLAKSGYVREDYAKALIEQAGFRFVASSPVGDNPRDTKNYPKGVWTLPPVLAMGQVDRAKYLAIGESDRWTMKFVKVGGAGEAVHASRN